MSFFTPHNFLWSGCSFLVMLFAVSIIAIGCATGIKRPKIETKEQAVAAIERYQKACFDGHPIGPGLFEAAKELNKYILVKQQIGLVVLCDMRVEEGFEESVKREFEDMRDDTTSTIMGKLIQAYRHLRDYFHIVERVDMKKIIDQQKINSILAILRKEEYRIDGIYPATHLLACEEKLSAKFENGGITMNVKLYDISTGEVLSAWFGILLPINNRVCLRE
jgi:hypothetical protein